MSNNTHFFGMLLVLCVLGSGCGTGPWFHCRGCYDFYQEPVYQRTQNQVRTDGYYLQTGELHPRSSVRYLLLFDTTGYVHSVRLYEDSLDLEIQRFLQNKGNDTLTRDLDWYKVVGDSLHIEFYGNASVQMVTFTYYQRGPITSDTTLHLKTENYHSEVRYYRFVPCDSVPLLNNQAPYADKKWYQRRLHESRKKPASP